MAVCRCRAEMPAPFRMVLSLYSRMTGAGIKSEIETEDDVAELGPIETATCRSVGDD